MTDIEEPKYDVEELLEVVPATSRQPYDVHEVLSTHRRWIAPRRVQGEVRRNTGYRLRAHQGIAVGIIANNGVFVLRVRNQGRAFR